MNRFQFLLTFVNLLFAVCNAVDPPPRTTRANPASPTTHETTFCDQTPVDEMTEDEFEGTLNECTWLPYLVSENGEIKLSAEKIDEALIDKVFAKKQEHQEVKKKISLERDIILFRKNKENKETLIFKGRTWKTTASSDKFAYSFTLTPEEKANKYLKKDTLFKFALFKVLRFLHGIEFKDDIEESPEPTIEAIMYNSIAGEKKVSHIEIKFTAESDVKEMIKDDKALDFLYLR